MAINRREIVFDDRSFQQYLAFVESGQQKWVMAKTLTQIANYARRELIEKSSVEWKIRAPGTIKAYRTEMATKQNLESKVGHIHWYAVDQTDRKSSIRSPLKATYRYIPLSGITRTIRGKLPYQLSPKVLTAKIKKQVKGGLVFYINHNDKKLIVRRQKGERKLTSLYELKKKQVIDPKVSMHLIAEKSAKKGQKIFNKNISQALKEQLP